MNSGIYILYNIYTGRKYIGSSRNLKHRKICHFSGMKRGTHENYKVQKEYNEYGLDGFRWEILEPCDVDKLMEREQYWLDTLKPELNILLTADNHNCNIETLAYKEGRRKQAEKIRGRKQSEDTKKKRAKSLIEYWAIPGNLDKLKKTDQQKQYLSEINMGERNPNWGKHRTPSSKKKAHDSVSKVLYTFKSSTGEEVSIRGLVTSAESELGISYGAARNLYRGLTKSYKGWTFVRSEKVK